MTAKEYITSNMICEGKSDIDKLYINRIFHWMEYVSKLDTTEMERLFDIWHNEIDKYGPKKCWLHIKKVTYKKAKENFDSANFY